MALHVDVLVEPGPVLSPESGLLGSPSARSTPRDSDKFYLPGAFPSDGALSLTLPDRSEDETPRPSPGSMWFPSQKTTLDGRSLSSATTAYGENGEQYGRSYGDSGGDGVWAGDASTICTARYSADSKGKGRAYGSSGEDVAAAHMVPTADDDEDTDEEEDRNAPLPRIGLKEGKEGQEDQHGSNSTADADDADDADDSESLSWAEYAPPAALVDVVPAGLPDLLCELAKRSMESVQGDVARAKAARDARAAKKAEAEAAAAATAAKESATKEASAGPLSGTMFEWPVARPKEPEPRPEPEVAKGESALAAGAAADMAAVASSKRSRRHKLAARLLRHIHGGGSRSNGSSSSSSSSSSNRQQQQQLYEASKSWALTEAGRSSISDVDLDAASLRAAKGEILFSQRRAAMVLEIMRNGSSQEKQKAPVLPDTIECVSCFDDVAVKEAVKTVCHSYCLDCFRRLVEAALENEAQFPPKCCLNEVPQTTVLKFVPPQLGGQYAAKVDEFSVPIQERLYCPHLDCGLFVPARYISVAARVGRCRAGHETCTLCRQPAHGTGAARQPCPDDADRRMADDLAAEEGWRRCYRCDVLIEHREACQHMTCRCGAEFCYVCGAPWHTCACLSSDLTRLKAAAADRRELREARELRERDEAEAADRELEELRTALQQVREFEQREAARRERAQQQLRRWLRQVQAEREAVLASEVGAKYAQYEMALAVLDAEQQWSARRLRREERAKRAHDAATARAALDSDLAARHTAIDAAAARRRRRLEQAWERDYAERLQLEAALESAYYEELEAAAQTTKTTATALRQDTAAKTTATALRKDTAARALRDYMRLNDTRLDAYLLWRQRELETARFHIEEERCVRHELLDRERQSAAESASAAAAEMRRRHGSERVWLRVVAAERARLLADMREVELRLGLDGSMAPADRMLLALMELERAGVELDLADMRAKWKELGSGGNGKAEAKNGNGSAKSVSGDDDDVDSVNGAD